jgi:uncharacterized protein involved in response to NO
LPGRRWSPAGAAQTVRLARWAGMPSWREPLVLVLHVGYALVPVGFFAVGGAALWPDAMPAGMVLHVWTTGGIVLMTLAVMTRATLGHTGRDLAAGVVTTAIYASALVALVARVSAPVFADAYEPLLHLAALAWFVVFGGFVVCYGPMLVRPRVT